MHAAQASVAVGQGLLPATGVCGIDHSDRFTRFALRHHAIECTGKLETKRQGMADGKGRVRQYKIGPTETLTRRRPRRKET